MNIKAIRTVTTIVLLLLPAALHSQSAISGQWQGKTPNGFLLELELAIADQALTGTFTRNGQRVPIAEGKLVKNTFTFQVTMNDQREGFTGEITKGQLKLWMDRQGPSAAAVLKRTGRAKRGTDAGVAGKWQGATASGRPLVLEIQVVGQRLTGRLTLAQQPVEMTDGKTDGQTFSFSAGEGRPVAGQGRLIGDELE